ncbi:hypothetical protein Scep_021277 [Stephania cephalantha]|uniref:Uncharacterized protein n=1 Tax=Stephania cephalantha TaxID=152367 RepID=A0AAP0F882_9MAGN
MAAAAKLAAARRGQRDGAAMARRRRRRAPTAMSARQRQRRDGVVGPIGGVNQRMSTTRLRSVTPCRERKRVFQLKGSCAPQSGLVSGLCGPVAGLGRYQAKGSGALTERIWGLSYAV